MDGFCIYGRAPVLCSASSDLAAHLAAEHRAEQRAEHVNGYINDAIDDMLRGDKAGELLADLSSSVGSAREVPLSRIYDADTGECSADTGDDWTRVMLLCEPEHLPLIRQQWLDWCRGQAAEYSYIVEAAEAMADDADELAREDAALFRAGVEA